MAVGGANIIDEVAVLLGKLDKEAFQAAVCRELQRKYPHFQPVPALPNDGGVDGLTHGNTRAYCCYGPILQSQHKKAKSGALSKDIVKKFTHDLHRIYGLLAKGRGATRALNSKPNTELPKVLGKIKLEHIRLVVNHFQDKSIIGPLNDALLECQKHSTPSYASPTLNIQVWGPQEVAIECDVDETTLHRLKFPAFYNNLDSAIETAPSVPTMDFDDKFDWLVAKSPERSKHIDAVRDRYRKAWAQAIVIEQRLMNVAPDSYHDAQRIYETGIEEASTKSITGTESDAARIAWAIGVCQSLQEKIRSRIQFMEAQYGESLGKGFAARLIGECYLDWRKTK